MTMHAQFAIRHLNKIQCFGYWRTTTWRSSSTASLAAIVRDKGSHRQAAARETRESRLRGRFTMRDMLDRAKVTKGQRIEPGNEDAPTIVQEESTAQAPSKSNTWSSLSAARKSNIRDMLKIVHAKGIAALTGWRERWLVERGIVLSDLERWNRIVAFDMADEAMPWVTEEMPAYVLLNLLRKPTFSREVVFRMLLQVNSTFTTMDDVSRTKAIQYLIQRAKIADPTLLLDICTNLLAFARSPANDRLLSQTLFYLSKGEKPTQVQPSAKKAAIMILADMRARNARLAEQDHAALIRLGLPGALHDANQAGFASRHQTHAHEGHAVVYKSDESNPTNRSQRDLILKRLKGDYEPRKLLHLMFRLRIQGLEEVWLTLLAREDSSADKKKTAYSCLACLKKGKLNATPKLLAHLLRAARGDRALVQQILTLVKKRGLPLPSSAGIELVRHFALVDLEGLFDVLRPETNLLSKHALCDPSTWSTALRALNYARAQRLHSAAQHAALMSLYTERFSLHRVAMTTSLLSALCEAALYSGERGLWQGKDSLLHVATLFKNHVDMGGQPWLLQASRSLWEEYMQLLVAGEQIDLLEQAVEGMLDTDMQVDGRNLGLFALGLLEAGDLDKLAYWQERLGEHGVSWPDDDHVFGLKSHLEARTFSLFRE